MANKLKAPRDTKSAPVAASILDYLLPIIGGAVVTMLVLWLLQFGATEVWSPFARTGAGIFKALTISALAGGIAAAILGRRCSGPIAATSPALGWALWGLSLHWSARGQYLQIMGGGLPQEATGILLFVNAISQSLSVAFALSIAAAVGWLWARRQNIIHDEAPVTDDDLEGNGIQSFGTAFVYPLATLFGGVIMLIIFGTLALWLGDPTVEQLPSGPGVAALCGLLTMAALFVATSLARRAFRALGNAGDIVMAPLVIALVAVFAQTPLLRPAALLIWHTSAFELASWGALGASLGFYFARSKMKVQ